MKRSVLIGLGAVLSVAIGTATIAQDAPVVPAPDSEVMLLGKEAFEVTSGGLSAAGVPCAFCHLATGRGAIGPNLVGNPIMEFGGAVVQIIIEGYIPHGMPPFGDLSDTVIAAIATYVRNSWGNAFGLVEPAQVAAIRAELAVGDDE